MLKGGQQGEIHVFNHQRLTQGRLLKAVICLLVKHRAQGLVTLHHMGEGLLQGRDIQGSGEAHSTRQVIGTAVRIKLPQKPHAPLRIRQCMAVILRHVCRNRELRKVDPFCAQAVEK